MWKKTRNVLIIKTLKIPSITEWWHKTTVLIKLIGQFLLLNNKIYVCKLQKTIKIKWSDEEYIDCFIDSGLEMSVVFDSTKHKEPIACWIAIINNGIELVMCLHYYSVYSKRLGNFYMTLIMIMFFILNIVLLF